MGGEGIPSRDRYIDAVFGETGYLARVFEGYRPRPGQIALARAVDESIAQRKHLFAEGPTGTGKSLAYAVPASYEASTTGKSVVIVTANIALQEQIVQKDLPLLRKVAPWPFTFALMKGRNNFLCVDRYLKHKSEAFRFGDGQYDAPKRKQLNVIETWAAAALRKGPPAERGDVSELPFEPDPMLWKKFSVGGDECKKSKCRHASYCFSQYANQLARAANVVVTNYHMLYSHLSVFMETGLDVVLPPFEICILDEAHKAPDIARDFFGFKISEGSIKRLARRLGRVAGSFEDERVAGELERMSLQYFHTMGDLKRDPERYKARIVPSKMRPHEMSAWTNLERELKSATNIFGRRVQKAEVKLAQMKADGDGMSDAVTELEDEIAEMDLDYTRASSAVLQLGHAMHATDPRSVYFLEDGGDRTGPVTVCSKLVHSSDALGPYLFKKRVGEKPAREDEEPDPFAMPGPRVSVVATSATLATDGNSFEYMAEEMGCEEYDGLVAESPFDWPNQCLFICPDGMPNPNDKEFADAVAKAVERTVLLARGRTLGLFTSRRVLAHTYDAIVGTCRANKYTLLRQGDEPRSKLIERFKTDVSSVLLGNESFWAGVDVPGEALSVVVIDRLPFPTPDDPVLDRLANDDDKWFFKYSVPRAIIAFKQGFGRLIRSMQCRGVVVCLDNRIVTKRYGKQFLRAIPNVPKSTNLDAIVEWLNPPRWDDVDPVMPPIEPPQDDEIPF